VFPILNLGRRTGEGDTLVVDTVGHNDKTMVDNYRTPHSEKLHVVERWRMTDDGMTLEVAMRVDDPETYNESWLRREQPQPVRLPHPGSRDA
jgi:hypothetical protein